VILHAAEVWVALALCFALGVLVGSIVYRAIALTALGKPQARLVHLVDRAILGLERRIMPWRTVPVVLPRTVAIPPPDFRHGGDEVSETASDAALPRFTIAPPIQLAEMPLNLSAPARATPAPSVRQSEALARGDVAGFRPVALSAPRHGRADPLYLIQGITRRHAGRLGQVGIFHFSQIASWTPQEVAWIAAYLGAGDGPMQKDWVGQAVHFASSDEPVEALEPAVAGKRKRMARTAVPSGDEPLRRKGVVAKPPLLKPRRVRRYSEPVESADNLDDGGPQPRAQTRRESGA